MPAPHCTRHSPHATITYQPVARCGQFIFCTGRFFSVSMSSRGEYIGARAPPGPSSKYFFPLPGDFKCRSRPDSAQLGPGNVHPHRRSQTLKQTFLSRAPAAKSPAPAFSRRRASQLPHRDQIDDAARGRHVEGAAELARRILPRPLHDTQDPGRLLSVGGNDSCCYAVDISEFG
jgi:hypothetical protein